MGMINEFKAFALRGNVVDLAVGIVIGTAFTAIVNSLVADIIMPPVGYATGGMDFSQLVLTLPTIREGADPVTINYGKFINALITFVIVAFALFILIKAMNTLKTKEAAKPASPAADPKDVILLQEIRDILARQSK